MRTCVGETVKVKDESMAPAFFAGDRVLVSKIHYGLRSPGSGSIIFSWKKIKPGDLVLIQKFSSPRLLALRRVIAVPGESIKMEKGTIYKKNKEGEWKTLPCSPSSTERLCWEKLGAKYFLRFEAQKLNSAQEASYSPLGENQVFVLSDNRKTTTDSRSFGPITLQEIVGKASHILLPAENKWIQGQDKVVVEGVGRRKFFSAVP